MRYVMLGVQIKGDGRGEEMISNSVLSLGFDDGSFYLLFSKSDGICLMRNRDIKRLSLKGSLVNGIGSMQIRDPSVPATGRLHSQGHTHLYSVANSTLLIYNNVICL